MMAFRLHHSVILDCSIETAWNVLSSASGLPRLQEILPSISQCVLTSAGEAGNATRPTASTAVPAKDELVEILSSQTFPADANLPWPSIDGSPEAAHFSFYESGTTFVEGAQMTAGSEHAVFFHSRVARAGVEEWKLRVLEAVDESRVRVTETVWGKAPFYIVWYLWLSGLATRVHREHMELYHTLMRDDGQ
ncbi:uncharacterized protein PV09_04775 [Verruconis gallopava]|uniref:Uncharacterized protein n=1 Tax=Verruconis gallopava TaxID=253628 RepID=A0A0D1YTG3_9PEZI|nr:uncharacterized protein PV09_04775 [Verruconis gallopava]KIW03937.1 hypothetical protein PV09_04775 [Verruconis gallopava]